MPVLHALPLSAISATELSGGDRKAADRLRQHLISTGHDIPKPLEVIELESVYDRPEPITYLRYPELPERSVVYLAGDSESGKSTLACAWGRDAVRDYRGPRAVLLLDGDSNPRNVIRDRFLRLGITESDALLFKVWDCQQREPVPMPDNHRVLKWVEEMAEVTGQNPLVIIDSLISFLPTTGDGENRSTEMRAFFSRCRAVTRAGGTALPLHHTAHNGAPRGSSDFRPAADQGFICTNFNPNNARLLCHIKLQVHKSRYGLADDIGYDYREGLMVRSDAGKSNDQAVLTALLTKNPGIGTREFVAVAKKAKVSDGRARRFLDEGVETRRIHREGTKTTGYKHYVVVSSDGASFGGAA
jgi:AAA domain